MPLYGTSRYPPYSGAVERAGKRPPADEDGRGSFGPVLVVLAVISFLAVSACIAGRLCGRRPSKSSSSRGEQMRGGGTTAAHADAEKGFGVMQNPAAAAVMRPVPSSRATVHDVDDEVFEIKLCAPVKPPTAAGRQGGSGGDGGGGSAPQPRPPPAVPLGVPRQYAAAAAAAAAAGFRRAPPASGGAAVRLTHPQYLICLEQAERQTSSWSIAEHYHSQMRKRCLVIFSRCTKPASSLKNPCQTWCEEVKQQDEYKELKD
uniref:Uncharacterized protein n=1 Tax=Oryza barthii TaxID=65489 RepID=A0A0D3GGR0_9ORYZ